MKNIHIIPTYKPSRLILQGSELLLSKYMEVNEGFSEFNQHLFITSDEEIKEGDWFVVELFKITGESDGLYIEKCNKLDGVWCNNFDVIYTRHKDNCKKIILTTDQDLIKDGVQAIEDEFLEWFVHNPSCEEVEVKKGKMKLNDDGEEYGFPDMSLYKITIPKEETLEEFIDKVDTPADLDQFTFDEGIRVGAKWQQERMYSEEEVLIILDAFLTAMIKGEKTGLLEKWFEQFKKEII